ncbi:uncharacterized protein LOC143219521 [Lasioglossum baleicum]|uniref:uncharacterized protein LOC143219521 n=1 Tax=Lasioglossum baleicum TaxID=434251 RepID=UPI003FCC2B85
MSNIIYSFIIRIMPLSLKDLAFLHMFIHAIFNYLIFICAGSYYNFINLNLKYYSFSYC